jgi:hypothetical protein
MGRGGPSGPPEASTILLTITHRPLLGKCLQLSRVTVRGRRIPAQGTHVSLVARERAAGMPPGLGKHRPPGGSAAHLRYSAGYAR